MCNIMLDFQKETRCKCCQVSRVETAVSLSLSHFAIMLSPPRHLAGDSCWLRVCLLWPLSECGVLRAFSVCLFVFSLYFSSLPWWTQLALWFWRQSAPAHIVESTLELPVSSLKSGIVSQFTLQTLENSRERQRNILPATNHDSSPKPPQRYQTACF